MNVNLMLYCYRTMTVSTGQEGLLAALLTLFWMDSIHTNILTDIALEYDLDSIT